MAKKEKEADCIGNILVVDDEDFNLEVIKEALEMENYNVCTATNGFDALDTLSQTEINTVFTDIKMERMSGEELLVKIKENYPTVSVVMMTAHGDIESAVKCMKQGAFDYLVKPVDLPRILSCCRAAMEHNKVVAENKMLARQNATLVQENKSLKTKVQTRNQMIGQCAAMATLRDIIARVAPTDARVLITGENGTGKEVVAHQIYEQSKRATAPFIEVNCAAIPSELIESELFGHEKGSFTGAVKQQTGKFEQADGGTLFLDEVGDMSLAAQAKVLRALQEHEISRVGSDKTIKVNVRVLAATNKNLKKEIELGNFREDLYHRLNVMPIHVPPLRERKEDIPLLVEHFAEALSKEAGTHKLTFEPAAIDEMKQYEWTGNIRELHNIVERLTILCTSTVTADDVRRCIAL